MSHIQVKFHPARVIRSISKMVLTILIAAWIVSPMVLFLGEEWREEHFFLIALVLTVIVIDILFALVLIGKLIYWAFQNDPEINLRIPFPEFKESDNPLKIEFQIEKGTDPE